jgi:hypothetical protein
MALDIWIMRRNFLIHSYDILLAHNVDVLVPHFILLVLQLVPEGHLLCLHSLQILPLVEDHLRFVSYLFQCLDSSDDVTVNIESKGLILVALLFSVDKDHRVYKTQNFTKHYSIYEVDIEEIRESSYQPTQRVGELIGESIDFSENLVKRLENYQRVVQNEISKEANH